MRDKRKFRMIFRVHVECGLVFNDVNQQLYVCPCPCPCQVDDMLLKARAQLSAADQLSLLPDLKSSPALQSPTAAAAVAYDTALAYVAEGYTRQLPHYIHTAVELFADAGKLANGQVGNMIGTNIMLMSPFLPRIVCALIYGRVCMCQPDRLP